MTRPSVDKIVAQVQVSRSRSDVAVTNVKASSTVQGRYAPVVQYERYIIEVTPYTAPVEEGLVDDDGSTYLVDDD